MSPGDGRSGWDRVWVHGRLVTFAGEDAEDAYGRVDDGAVAVSGGRIGWVGPTDELPRTARAPSVEVRDVEGRWITPGLVDCHTHLVFAGDRAAEFERRLAGTSYEEIAREGGGILSTVRATRAASETELLELAEARAHRLLADGVTTLEVKSGYGLDPENELRMLRVGRTLGDRVPARVCTTFLGLHALPPGVEREDFVDTLVRDVLPAVAEEGLADAVDAFAERIAFSDDECARFFRAAREKGLPIRLHADQLSDSGGAALAARFEALSADHLEYASRGGVGAMARSGTVAVLLPGAFYFLGGGKKPPVDAFRELGVPIAVATDANPGSSPLLSILTAMNLGCVLFGLTPAEALAGVTANASRALGLADEVGTLEPGKRADLAIWDVEHPRELAYWLGPVPLHEVVYGGEPRAAPARYRSSSSDGTMR